MKVLDLQYQYGMATESKTLNCFQIQIQSICYASEGIRLAILYHLKEVTIRLERLIFFIPVDPLKMRTSVTSSYPYFLYVLDEIPMSTYFFHFHKGHSIIYIYQQSILTSRKNIVSFSEFLCLKVALKSLWASVWLWLINSTEAGGSITNE